MLNLKDALHTRQLFKWNLFAFVVDTKLLLNASGVRTLRSITEVVQTAHVVYSCTY